MLSSHLCQLKWLEFINSEIASQTRILSWSMGKYNFWIELGKARARSFGVSEWNARLSGTSHACIQSRPKPQRLIDKATATTTDSGTFNVNAITWVPKYHE